MRAGRLSDLILFQRKVLTVSGDLSSATWPDDFSAWSEVERISETQCKFIIRYRSDISPDSHRIIWEDRIWTIDEPVHDRRRTQLTIDSNSSRLVEATHLQSEQTEYVEGVPTVRPRS